MKIFCVQAVDVQALFLENGVSIETKAIQHTCSIYDAEVSRASLDDAHLKKKYESIVYSIESRFEQMNHYCTFT